MTKKFKLNSRISQLINFLVYLIFLFLSKNSIAQSRPNEFSFVSKGENYEYKGEYKLIFQDEFDGTSLNKDKWITWFPDQCGDEKPDAWGIQNKYARLGSDENGLQIYRDENVIVKDGNCSLIAKKETSTWAGVTKSWTSGLIRTKNKFSFDRGRWEIKCKIPKGDGFWCAFWGSGGDEIDVFESGSKNSGKLNQEIHTEYNPNPVNTGTDWRSLGFDYSESMHTYAIEWDLLYVTWIIDNTVVKRVWGYKSSDQKVIGTTDLSTGVYYKLPNFPVDPQCIIANFCISNHEGFGYTSSSTPTTASFVIDYIRVYQRNDNIQSGYEDLCNFKLSPINLVCNNSSQSISINANSSNFKAWTAYNATIANSSSANTTFTPTNNGSVKITATAKDFCNTTNSLDFWYGKPRHTIKVEPIRCSKCWKVTNDNNDLMKASYNWKIGTTIEYLPEDCTGTLNYSIPATFTSTNTCGTYKYSTNIVSNNTNCGGTTGTQFVMPISNDFKFENLIYNLGAEAQAVETNKIIIYRLTDNTSQEIKLDFSSFNYATQSKGLYVVFYTNLKTGVQSYIKLIKF